MPGPLLFSTNVFLKLMFQEKYYKDIHYAWFSELFDSQTQPRYSSSSLVAASANPAQIYRELIAAVKSKDKHCSKIAEQRASFIKHAKEQFDLSNLTAVERDDIIYWATEADFDYWRPVLYITPRQLVLSRMQLVPPERRAGLGNEYIVPDLARNEFDVIEFSHA